MDDRRLKMTLSGSSAGGGGIGLDVILGVVFIVLKLVGVINWPWIWILAPFWIGALIGIIFLVVFFVIMMKMRR